jgi:hypothetical protein
MVRLARANLTFHADCWAILNLNVQREYELRAQDEGLAALLGPYHRGGSAAWLPVEGPERPDEAAGHEVDGTVPDPAEDDQSADDASTAVAS